MPQILKQPVYRLHKARNCAVVTLSGKNHYLGPWQSPESHEKYARLIAEWRRNNGVLPVPVSTTSGVLTVNDLILAYFRHAQTRYIKHGKPTSEISCLRYALRPLRQLYGTCTVSEIGPRALKDVRQAMIDGGRCRTAINKDAERIKRMFKWAAGEEMIDASIYQRIKLVERLKRGQSSAVESEGVGPVAVEHVEAVLPLLPPPVAAMVRLQLLTGCRPQEAMALRPGEITKRADGLWLYTPTIHKTEHHDRERVIFLGPKAQEVLTPWLDREAETYCFTPAESVA